MVAWNNYIMQKYGGSIFANVYLAAEKFHRAVVSTAINKAVIRQENDRLKDLPNIADIKDEDFFKDS